MDTAMAAFAEAICKDSKRKGHVDLSSVQRQRRAKSYAVHTDVGYGLFPLGPCRGILWAMEAALELSGAPGFCGSAGLDADAAVVQWQGESPRQTLHMSTQVNTTCRYTTCGTPHQTSRSWNAPC